MAQFSSNIYFGSSNILKFFFHDHFIETKSRLDNKVKIPGAGQIDLCCHSILIIYIQIYFQHLQQANLRC